MEGEPVMPIQSVQQLKQTQHVVNVNKSNNDSQSDLYNLNHQNLEAIHRSNIDFDQSRGDQDQSTGAYGSTMMHDKYKEYTNNNQMAVQN